MDVTVRPLAAEDVESARIVAVEAFAEHNRRMGEPVDEDTPERVERRLRRLRHFLRHDPDGCWVGDYGGEVVGVALASVRDGLWGLSLLVVAPAMHGKGIGRRLLDATLSYGATAPRGVIMATRDPGAIRLYATSGFELHPQVRASGVIAADRPSAAAPSSRVRPGSVGADRELLDAVDRAARGVARGPDHDMLSWYADLLVADDAAGRGYVYTHRGAVETVVATDEATAAELLGTSLAISAESGHEAVVEHINAGQQWAVRTVLDAGLTIAPSGPAFWRGSSPPAAYLPSGPYL
jgi:GNAT superfamily N-acetyltransferase